MWASKNLLSNSVSTLIRGATTTVAQGDSQPVLYQSLGTSRLRFLCAAVFSVFSLFAQADIAPANTRISNQGYMELLLPSGETDRVLSNHVFVDVLPVSGFALNPNHNVVAAAGAEVVFSHQLLNAGNTAASFKLNTELTPGDFELLGVALYRDVNANGELEPAERGTEVNAVELAPGASAHFLLRAQLPPNAAPGDVAYAQLCAADQIGSQCAVDQVSVSASPLLVLSKTASRETVQVGDSVAYRLLLENQGAAVAKGIQVKLDGANTTAVVVADKIAQNAALQQTAANPGVTLAYKAVAAEQHHYQTTIPPPDELEAVIWLIDPLPPAVQRQLDFSVSVTQKNDASLPNVATFYSARFPAGQGSNRVSTLIVEDYAQLRFFDADFQNEDRVLGADQSAYLQLQAAGCNQNSALAEQYQLRLSTAILQDLQTVTIVETGVDTGIFRVGPVSTSSVAEVAHENGQLEVRHGDQILAQVNNCAAAADADANILIDPFGVVYDALTNEPVAGAEVTLYRLEDGQLRIATVYQDDGVTLAPSVLITAEDGAFRFPLVPSGMYQLGVVPPAGYRFPSVIKNAFEDRVINEPGSFGGLFEVSERTGVVHLDVPLDTSGAALIADVSVSPNQAYQGDLVAVNATVRNHFSAELGDTVLQFSLPAGTRLQAETVLINGTQWPADAIHVQGTEVSIQIGALPAAATLTVQFFVEVAPGAQSGTVALLAYGEEAGTIRRSNVAEDALRLYADQYHGHIIGRVFLDCNRNRQQGVEELGVPGVRLYLQDGRFAVTDSEGKYSFYGLTPRLHVLRLDTNTLPPGAELEVLNLAHAGDPTSRFVDLKRNELHRANFAEQSCAPSIMAEVIERRRKGRVTGPEIERVGYSRLVSVKRQQRKLNKLPARGLFDDGLLQQGKPAQSQGKAAHPISIGALALLHQTVGDVGSVKLPPSVDSKLGFVDLQDGQILTRRQQTIRIKGPAQVDFQLAVDGQVVPSQRVGKRVTFNRQRAAVWEYVGVDLAPGENQLQLSVTDPFGNVRGKTVITVQAPGDLAELEWVDPGTVTADGHTPVNLAIRLLDSNGLAVNSRSVITIETDAGEWLSADQNDSQPGVQVISSGNLVNLKLLPPMTARSLRLTARVGDIAAEYRLSLGQEQRSMMIVGLLEGAAQYQLEPVGDNEYRFDAAIDELATTLGENGRVAGRAAVFAKGRVADDIDLTLRYDSEGIDQSLFLEQNSNRYYPVWGDASLRGFDARSTSRFYARVDKGRSWAEYGDFSTRSANEAVDLARSNRALTGLQLHYQGEQLNVHSYASQNAQRAVVDEIPGRGLSGLYTLSNAPIVENSEAVEIITRDAEQPDVILQSKPLRRYLDYELDYRSGEILLTAPLASFNTELDPLSLRVSYSTETAVDQYWLSGIEANLRFADNFTLGAVVSQDDSPEDQRRIVGANFNWQQKTEALGSIKLLFEVARAERQAGLAEHAGNAARVRFEQQTERWKARFYYGYAEENYFNEAASLRGGREEWNARLSWKLAASTSLTSTLRQSRELSTDNSNRSLQLGINHFFEFGLRAEIGVQELQGDNVDDRFSARANLQWTVPWVEGLRLSVDGESALQESAEGKRGNRLMAALDYDVLDYASIYARHTFIHELGCRGGLAVASGTTGLANCTLIGIESKNTNGARLFSEYRVRDSLNGNEAEAVLGLRQALELAEGLTLNASLERVEPLGGSETQSTAATLSGVYSADESWKASARLEYRTTADSDSWLNTLAWAKKLDRDWTLLARSYYRLNQRQTIEDSETRLQLGMAYRDTDDDQLTVLARYEWRETVAEQRQQQHIWQLSMNTQTSPEWQSSWYYGLRWNRYAEADTAAHVLVNRWQYEINDRWGAGSMLALESNRDASLLHGGLGLELGYLAMTNLWLSLGYNAFGFEADDLDGAGVTQQGGYFNFRFKFDEYSLLPERWLR